MNGHLAAKISRLGVANLYNTAGIACDLRLDTKNLSSQPAPLRLNQTFPKKCL